MYSETLLMTGWLIKLSQLNRSSLPAHRLRAMVRLPKGFVVQETQIRPLVPHLGRESSALLVFGFKSRAIPCVVFFFLIVILFKIISDKSNVQ